MGSAAADEGLPGNAKFNCASRTWTPQHLQMAHSPSNRGGVELWGVEWSQDARANARRTRSRSTPRR